MLEKQIELEKKITQASIDNYRNEYFKNKENGNFSNSAVAVQLISRILDTYTASIQQYLYDYGKGYAVHSTIAAQVINKLNDVPTVAYVASKVILNSMWLKTSSQAIYKAIGQALEDEYKMRAFKEENSHYYKSIQEDLNKRGAKAKRKKNITTGVFSKRLDFHLDQWTISEKFQVGLVLSKLFIDNTGLVEYENRYEKGKHYKNIIPSQELVEWIENINEKLEVMQPFFLPMIHEPKEWTGVLEGGYISPYLKKNKLVKNNNKEYLKKLETAEMPIVYEAINHIQSTKWQINRKVLDVAMKLWERGVAIAELPDREDEPLIPYPYPEKNTKTDSYTEEEVEVIKKWKRDTYEIHKRNVQKRSVRILVSQILRIANQFKNYENIWFPYQMDFRGRIYPIPVLLQPQGSDLAKGLLYFAEGKKVNNENIRWLQIHGANVYGYDKASYEDRIKWVKEREELFRTIIQDPISNQTWAEADKPFQFLAFCYEYVSYLDNPDEFHTHIPIQLDGTCNGLQHYSALLKDPVGGRAVNLLDADLPNDIYATVAEKLKEKLNDIQRDNNNNSNSSDMLLATAWLNLGINRKLTKRPVMVLPYGGTIMSCREYVSEYLTDNYSPTYLWSHFKIGENPTDCIFKVSVWLSRYLWQAIQDTLRAAIVGMDYLRKIARILNHKGKPLEWLTPAGLLIHQSYPTRKQREIKTELYGSILRVRYNADTNTTKNHTLDYQRQVNGICPNFIHSLDATCLMFYLIKCKRAGINSIMSVHDCYGTLAPDCDLSAKFLREAFVEIYRKPILKNFLEDVTAEIEIDEELPPFPDEGDLNIEEVLDSKYFFN